MYYDESTQAFNFLAGVVLGAAVGAGVALLLAPQSGSRTRRRLLGALSGARNSATGRWDELAGDVRTVVRSGRRRLPFG